MSSFRLEIVTPTRSGTTSEVEFVVVPTAAGEIGILPGHAHLLGRLATGVLRFTAGGKTNQLAVRDGYVAVTHGNVVVLAEAAEFPDEIDVERALAAKQRAEKRLRTPKNREIDQVRAWASLRRSLNRLDVAKGRSSHMGGGAEEK